jgi:tRNA threonylcarbamoyladenosine biosynthesis protein TsaB
MQNKINSTLTLLALDASTEACSVAILKNGKIQAQFELCPQSHSLLLLPMIDNLLKQTNTKLTDLDGLVFGRGPGSFTGVRIGIGVAQGLAFSANLPLVGISTLQALAQRGFIESGEQQIIAAIDARMSELYCAAYQLDQQQLMQPITDEKVLAVEPMLSFCKTTLQTAYGVGTGWDSYATELLSLRSNKQSVDVLYPHAEDMLLLAIPEFEQGNSVSAENAQPVYVRDTVSWQKLPGK